MVIYGGGIFDPVLELDQDTLKDGPVRVKLNVAQFAFPEFQEAPREEQDYRLYR